MNLISEELKRNVELRYKLLTFTELQKELGTFLTNQTNKNPRNAQSIKWSKDYLNKCWEVATEGIFNEQIAASKMTDIIKRTLNLFEKIQIACQEQKGSKGL